MKQTQKFLLVLVLLILSVPTWAVDSLNTLKSRAEQGDVEAQSSLGGMYYLGKGVPRDYKETARWFLKSAENGAPKAQFYLGWMYDKGQGLPRDYRVAAGWYHKAAEQGDADA